MAVTDRQGRRAHQHAMSEISPAPEPAEPPKDTRIKPGEVRNPKGRPKGSRNKLGESFIAALADDFEAHGIAAIVAVREKRPSDYLKVIASLVPQQIEVRKATDELSDEKLDALIAALEGGEPLRIVAVTDVPAEAEPYQSPEKAADAPDVSKAQPTTETPSAAGISALAPALGQVSASRAALAMAADMAARVPGRASSDGNDGSSLEAGASGTVDASRPEGVGGPMGDARDGEGTGGPTPKSDPPKVAVSKQDKPKDTPKKIAGPRKNAKAHAEALARLRKPK